MTDQSNLVQKKKWIRELDADLSEGRARRIIEIETPELIGKGLPPALEPDQVPEDLRTTYFDLNRSMNRIWTEATMSYVYGFFQSCTFLAGAMLELAIERFLRLRLVWSDYESRYKPKRRWLGTLVEFCEDNGLLDDETLEAAYRINDLRIDAVHMKTEKMETGTPSDEHPLVEWEDATMMRARDGRVSIEAVALPGQPMIIDLSNPAAARLRREQLYKPQAAAAFGLLSKILWILRPQAGRDDD